MDETPHPSSPGTSAVSLSDCIEELLKFLLSTSTNETLEIDLGLSKSYCYQLLQQEPASDTNPGLIESVGTSGGVPTHPLYKHLASALHSCITSGTYQRTSCKIASIEEDESLKHEENDWSKLIESKGAELINMLKAVNFELFVQEPFFTQLRVGKKTVEGRCAVGDYNRIAPGALLLINRCLMLEVQNVKRYASFAEMLKEETLSRVLPGVKTIEEGVQIYQKFYTEEKEKSNGVLAICVSRSAIQPYISMACVIRGLNYNGIGSLLGLTHTAGTIPDALPPSRSALLSSFMMPHQPNVKGCALTDGARALAKHVNRSSDGWWGNFGGSDFDKNRLALKVFSHLLNCCCWMNIYIIQPHDHVFEIRVADGYGARWSSDGSKFIGFLEPYMQEGHLKGWKH